LKEKPRPNKYTIYNDYAILKIHSVTHGEFEVILDLEDVSKCKQYTWGIYCSNRRKGKYVSYYITNNKVPMLHRFLMGNPKGKVVDHADGDTMNNRKYNLRICEHYQNGKNRKFNQNNQSGHKGVFWDHALVTPKWRANIKVGYKTLHLGYFDNYEDAVACRERAEEKYFGEFNRAM
jgi:hypothetical protein